MAVRDIREQGAILLNSVKVFNFNYQSLADYMQCPISFLESI
jgi:hypothetical protein